MKKPRTITYSSYLRTQQLLSLQRPAVGGRDEMLFICVHQAFEIWFRLAIYELEKARAAMDARKLPGAVHTLRRVHAILRTATPGFDVVETMRPYDFLEFRKALEPSSGFQSIQFRELEFLSGRKDPRYLRVVEPFGRKALERRLAEPTLWDSYVALLKRSRLKAATGEQILRTVIRIMESPDRHPLWGITEALLVYDQLFLGWRSRHIHMTMRMIGEKPGTGRSGAKALVGAGYDAMGEAGGIGYLKTTLTKVFFPILWEAQTYLTRK